MQIALIGYGKMGKTIETLLVERGHSVHSIFDSKRLPNVAALACADVAIEFTRPELALSHLRICAEANCPVVIGTTGWNHLRQEAFAIVKEFNAALFFASNFSPGVNIAFYLTEVVTALLKKFPEYRPTIEEIHHAKKLDAPSGTAITFAEKIMEQNPSFVGWNMAVDPSYQEIQMKAIREGNVPGTHHIRFTSANDQIEISHYAFNRLGFAAGAITAAEFLFGKSGIYSMSDLLSHNISELKH